MTEGHKAVIEEIGMPRAQYVGADIPREYANAFQVFQSPDGLMIVFRDQTTLDLFHTHDKFAAPETHTRNVASIFLPLPVAIDLGEALRAASGT